jgi:hypothetical protein
MHHARNTFVAGWDSHPDHHRTLSVRCALASKRLDYGRAIMRLSNTTEAAFDIGFFRALGIALVVMTAVAGSMTLTLTLQGDAHNPQVVSAVPASPVATD